MTFVDRLVPPRGRHARGGVTAEDVRSSVLAACHAAADLCPGLEPVPASFHRRPIAEPGMTGCWDGRGITVSWHGTPMEFRSLLPILVHEHGHQALQSLLRTRTGQVASVRRALALPGAAGLSAAAADCPFLIPFLDAYRADPGRHGSHGHASPEEWFAEGFRLASGARFCPAEDLLLPSAEVVLLLAG